MDTEQGMIFGDASESQMSFGMDDGSGLRVVSAKFNSEKKFDWDVFNGFDTLRVLTYSVSVDAIVRMLDKYAFTTFECVFGYEGIIRDMKDILAFQKTVVGNTRAAIMGLKDERHIQILEKVHSGQAHFRVLRKSIAHAKLYLLSNSDGRKRVIIGSANLSERAFSGDQPETLVMFDNDENAWEHYNNMFNTIRDSASDEIELPDEKITRAEIEIRETPSMNNGPATLIIEPPAPDEIETSFPAQVERVEKVLAALGPALSSVMPPIRNGKQRITQNIKRQINRVVLVKSAEEVDTRDFHIDRTTRHATLSGDTFPLKWDNDSVNKDARLLLEYFENYAAFEGDVKRLQRDYFTLMAWLYFSPFMCDMRSLAMVRDSDVVRFPSFGIVFGKSNCGKTSLIDTLMTSMFGYANTVDKRSFTTSRLRGLQASYKRFPVVFDDIGQRAFNQYGKDMIKEELQPLVSEYPCFILAMNAEPQSFPDEIVKRSLMIYTTTALPSHEEETRQRLQGDVQKMRRGLTGHLYKRYLVEIMEHIDPGHHPDDWLAISSQVISDIISEGIGKTPPEWCRKITWQNYAGKRYDRVKAALESLLRQASYVKKEGEAPKGWTIDGEKVIVWEPRDAFGRRAFNWEDVPSTLIDQDASHGDTTILHKTSLQKFIGHKLYPPGKLNKIKRLFSYRS